MSDLMRPGSALAMPADGAYGLTPSAGRELDALVAEKVMGWKPVLHFGARGTGFWTVGDSVEDIRHDDEIPHYSTEIAAAWLVVERLRATRPYEEFGIGILPRIGGDIWRCCVGMTIWGDGETTPLAICRAALAATAP